ncbi:MAG: 2-C-methyl-D-erythritol 4-phosphate cytidylyltransferase, partial [Dehalococcoidia bacterium]
MREPNTASSGEDNPSIGAMILAAGLSRRMGGTDKTFALLSGKPLVLHSLEVFQACSFISRTVLVLAGPNLDKGRRLIDKRGYKERVSICLGGPHRQDSARCGLALLEGCEWVVVHDGARPCLDLDTLNRGISNALEHGNAVAAVPVVDTIKVADDEGHVVRTPPRQELWAAQTPQI